MKVFFLPLVLGAFLAVSANRTENVNVLGTVGGKTFVGTNANLTWNEAKAFCIKNGWSLATITSNAQANFLKSVYDPVNFNGWYWMGAQYNENTDRFIWTETGERVESLNSLGFSSWSNEDEDKNCLCYSSNSHAEGYYFRRTCHHVHPTLCESSRPIERTNIIQQSREELREIGTFRGKTYFGDNIIRNWTESAEICKSKGLQLASVSSNPAQLQFLKKSTKLINIDGWFWIAKSTANIFTPARSRGRETSNCPCFSARNGGHFRRGCFHQHFTLCESVSSGGLQTSVNRGYDTPEANPERSEMSTEPIAMKVLKLLSDNLKTLSAKQKQEILQLFVLLDSFNSLDLADSTEEIFSSEEK
ncbi:unnamed protein product [Orchesella dallaii]|uniref:C-type lectin domain-containing protein n=1 Tax=Orchesella dallaii TaxID=48710 RepID=A0ABP1PLX8_9HEXA